MIPIAMLSLGPGITNALASSGGKMKDLIGKFLIGIFIFIIVGVIIYFIYKSYKNKVTYTTPITLTTIMDNGMGKDRYDLRGGMFWNNGIRDFKIKAPKVNKPHILGYVPDMSKANSIDGRLHFITSGDNTAWQQVDEKWVTTEKVTKEDGTIEVISLIKKPIPAEIKKIAINSIKNWKDTVSKEKITVFGIALGAFIIMVIAHLISLFIQTRLKCGVPA